MLRPLLATIGVALTACLAAAHFVRAGASGMAVATLLLPALLLTRRRWVQPVLTMLLLAAVVLWATTAADLASHRRAAGLPWLRLAVILGGVTLFTGAVALAVARGWLRFAQRAAATASASAMAFLLTLALLTIIQLKVPRPMLLAERFAVGAGWVEVLALATYAGWLAERMSDPAQHARWRRRVWALFSIVFFAQLILGLTGLETLLMNAAKGPHFPIPALIVAGPIYRGGQRLFMLTLFLSTVVLVGPAWCSHLCYFGVWDNLAADRLRPRKPSRWWCVARVVLLVAVLLAAVLLHALGASPAIAGAAALGFGLVGVSVMLLLSRRRGVMVHCTVYCPIGLLACTLGKLSPFRVRIGDGCIECMKCRPRCRYSALERDHIQARRVGINCTLCGDCVSACDQQQLRYAFFGLSPDRARAAFVVLIVALHAASLGLARV